jgi:hypothetical protein
MTTKQTKHRETVPLEPVPEIGIAVPMPSIPEITVPESKDYFVIHQAADGNWKGKRVRGEKVTETRAVGPDTALLELITMG